MVAARLVQLGTVVKPHGYKGAFLVHSVGGKDSALGYCKKLWVGPSQENVQVHEVIESAWMPKGWKVQLAGISSEVEVNSMRGFLIFVERQELKKLGPSEYYIEDLIGLKVFEQESDRELGVLLAIESRAVDSHQGQDIWKIGLENKHWLVPAVEKYIAKVDLENKAIWITNLKDLDE